MAKLMMICITSLLILAAGPQEEKLSRLHSVKMFEIQEAILVTPVYSDAGEVCRVVLEKRHLSSKGIDLDAEMSREEIQRVFDELAPKQERGQPKLKLGENGEITTFDGPALVTFVAYENVSIQMYGKNNEGVTRGYVAAIIHWQKRKCRQ